MKANRKFMSLLLASVLAFSLAVPAFADNEGSLPPPRRF